MHVCIDYYNIYNIHVRDYSRGGFRVLIRGVRTGERSEPKFFGTLLAFFGTGGANLHRGVPKKKPSTYKHRADI